MATLQEKYFIHSTCIIEENSNIGAGSDIQHFSVIEHHCTIESNVKIGSHAKVHAQVTLRHGVNLEDHVVIFQGTRVGSYATIGSHASIGSAPTLKKKDIEDRILRRVEIGVGVLIGAHSTILRGCALGDYAIVQPGSVLEVDVPAHALMAGKPAVQKGWVCKCRAIIEPIKEKLSCASCGLTYTFDEYGLHAEGI